MASVQLSPILLLIQARSCCPGRSPRMATVSCKYNQPASAQGPRLKNHIVVTRRNALSFMSSAALAALLAAGPAEARTSRLENKKKAMEKLEKIREKALGPRGKNGDVGKGMPPANLLVPPPAVEASLRF